MSSTVQQRIVIRPTAADIEVFEKIGEIAPQTRSEIVRNALNLACAYLRHPFVLVNPLGRTEQPLIASAFAPNRVGVVAPDRETKDGLIQVRRDPELDQSLEQLLKDGRFGRKITAVVRTTTDLLLWVLERVRDGSSVRCPTSKDLGPVFDVRSYLKLNIVAPEPIRFLFELNAAGRPDDTRLVVQGR